MCPHARLPFAVGWAIGGTWVYGVTALLWAGLVRIALLHHVTWSVNSLCHLIGERPFRTRRHDRGTNLWPLALLSFGESWHNLHHADPTCARRRRIGSRPAAPDQAVPRRMLVLTHGAAHGGRRRRSRGTGPRPCAARPRRATRCACSHVPAARC
ncbi:hypothetical protein [Streptomyces sp. NBC_00299]|uniref:hypothetical protein n=1 Tax=Streptomyces sp. NBC_00299 TaxID=2975705 RepID=UPI0032525402